MVLRRGSIPRYATNFNFSIAIARIVLATNIMTYSTVLFNRFHYRVGMSIEDAYNVLTEEQIETGLLESANYIFSDILQSIGIKLIVDDHHRDENVKQWFTKEYIEKSWNEINSLKEEGYHPDFIAMKFITETKQKAFDYMHVYFKGVELFTPTKYPF